MEQIRKLYEQMGDFSLRKFPDCTAKDHLVKLKEEAEEAINEPADIEEYADCLLALLGASFKAGIWIETLLSAAEQKLRKVENYRWIKQKDGTYQHEGSTLRKRDVVHLIMDFHPSLGVSKGWSEYVGGMADIGRWYMKHMYLQPKKDLIEFYNSLVLFENKQKDKIAINRKDEKEFLQKFYLDHEMRMWWDIPSETEEAQNENV